MLATHQLSHLACRPTISKQIPPVTILEYMAKNSVCNITIYIYNLSSNLLKEHL